MLIFRIFRHGDAGQVLRQHSFDCERNQQRPGRRQGFGERREAEEDFGGVGGREETREGAGGENAVSDALHKLIRK